MTTTTDISSSASSSLEWFSGSVNQPEQIPEELAVRLPEVEFALKEWRDYHVTIPGATRLKVGNVWIELDEVDGSGFEGRTFMHPDDDIGLAVGTSPDRSVDPFQESTPESQVNRFVTRTHTATHDA